MMIRLTLLATLLTLVAPASAQDPLLEVWGQRFEPASAAFTVNDTDTRNGWTSVVGYDFDGAAPNPYAVQFSPDGTVAWAAVTPVAGDARALAVAVGENGDTYVVGTRVLDLNADLFVLRYNTDGSLLWSTIYDETTGSGLNPSVWSKTVALGADGRVYALADSDDDYLVIALDADGSVLWSDLYDGPGGEQDTPTAIAVDEAGRVFVTGHSDRIDGGIYEAATIAYAPDGARLWEHRYAGPLESTWSSLGADLSPDGEGGVFLAGFAFSTDVHHAVVMHYDASGDPTWVATHPGPPQLNTSFRMLRRGPDGSLIAVGVTQPSPTDLDLLLFGYDTEGNKLWENQHASTPFVTDYFEDVLVGPDGEVYVVGWRSLGDAEGVDFVVARYGATGEYESHVTSGWTGPGPSPCHERPAGAGFGPSGAMYVAGASVCGPEATPSEGAYAARFSGVSTPSEPGPPTTSGVLEAYPNPFRNASHVEVVAPKTGLVVVSVFDVLGRRVATLFDGVLASGVETTLTLNGSGLPNGVYVVRAEGAGWSSSQRAVKASY